jgi:hypothetical protein
MIEASISVYLCPFVVNPGKRRLGSPNSMNFIPWKKTLGGYQSAFGFNVARCSLS